MDQPEDVDAETRLREIAGRIVATQVEKIREAHRVLEPIFTTDAWLPDRREVAVVYQYTSRLESCANYFEKLWAEMKKLDEAKRKGTK